MTEQERFWVKVDRTQDCWLWTASTWNGYGQFRVGGKWGRKVYAHRWVYELLVGPIPDGLQIDHLCRVRHCVNPAHLEAVTQRENVRREGATITHCPQGHRYDSANTFYNRRGWRQCRTCARERMRRQGVSA